MKSGKSFIPRELWIILGCIVLALLVNAYAINKYQTQWNELLTTWRISLAVAGVIYSLVWAIRLLFAILKRLFFR